MARPVKLCLDRIGVPIDTRRNTMLDRGVSESRKIDREHLEAALKRGQHGCPLAPAAANAVNQHQRLASPALVLNQAGSHLSARDRTWSAITFCKQSRGHRA